MNIIRLLTVMTGLLLSVTAHAEPAKRVPVEDFFAEDDYSSMQISPDGKNLTFLTTLGTGKVGIAIMDLMTGKIDALVAAKDENIKFYFWKGNDYIVYGGDIGGDESPALRSITVNPGKNGKRRVTPLSEAYNERSAADANFLNVQSQLRFDAYRFMAWGRKGVGDWHVANYLVDVRDGKRTPVGSDESIPDIIDLAIDNAGVIRGRSRYEGNKIVYEFRPNPRDRFTKFVEFPADEPEWEMLQFAADNDTLYVVNREKTETGTLHMLHLPTKKLSEPLFGVSDGEIESPILSYDRTKLYGVSYLSDRQYYKFFDADRERLQKQVDGSLAGTHNIIVSTSADEKKLVVFASNDRDPGTYYLLDLTRPAMSVIGKVNRRIDPAQMAVMEPIKYQARDGLTIHGYLTRPAGTEGKKVPLIINPHGGPFGIRDAWGFNGEVQFLANRGYAVLQINYRGSGGYGTSFQQAGQREWGGKMQDDLTDGVKWAIAQGFADPARIAIYGASYGGFAALAGVTFTPELYCCAVNYVGVSDLSLLRRWGIFGGRGRQDFLKDWVGTDKDYLRDHSPVNFVDRIRVPTLHAYGFNDPRVDIEHWKRLEPKLKQYNKPYEIMIMGDEGHGFYNERNRIDFYRRLETFFEKHLASARTGTVNVPEMQVLEMPVGTKP